MPIQKKVSSSATARASEREARINQVAAMLSDGFTYRQIAEAMGVTKGVVAGILHHHGDAVAARMKQIREDKAAAATFNAEVEKLAEEGMLWTDADEAEAIASYEAAIAPLPEPIETVASPVHSREYVDTMLSQNGIHRILLMSSNGRSVQDISSFLDVPVLVVESVILDAGMTAYWHDETERVIAILRDQHTPFTPTPDELAFPDVVDFEPPAPPPPVLPVSLISRAATRLLGFFQQLRVAGARRLGVAS